MLNREELVEEIKNKAKLANVLVKEDYLNNKTDEDLVKFAKQLDLCAKNYYKKNSFALPKGHINMQFNVSNRKII